MDTVVNGFKFAAVSAQIKKLGTDRLDFGLIVAEAPCVTAGMTTTNRVFAAPVKVTRERLAAGLCRVIVANSGNANACTGEAGTAACLCVGDAVAKRLGVAENLVIPMSTGVIGAPFPTERMLKRIPELVERLSPEAAADFAHAIMTTDTRPKMCSYEGELSTGRFTVLGIAKGAGMIAPDMATMLAVALTDARPSLGFLREVVNQAGTATFNRITIDGDTSTNDTLVVMAGPSAGSPELKTMSDEDTFASVLNAACDSLAEQMVADGEGATKLVRIRVSGAPSESAGMAVAKKVANSPLVKTAFHGEDPNWGRIIAAAGMAGVEFDPAQINLAIGDVPILVNGRMVEGDWETPAHTFMTKREFTVSLDLGAGDGQAEVLTTDFSKDYVTINADYRS